MKMLKIIIAFLLFISFVFSSTSCVLDSISSEDDSGYNSEYGTKHEKRESRKKRRLKRKAGLE